MMKCIHLNGENNYIENKANKSTLILLKNANIFVD